VWGESGVQKPERGLEHVAFAKLITRQTPKLLAATQPHLMSSRLPMGVPTTYSPGASTEL